MLSIGLRAGQVMQIRGGSGGHGLTALLNRHEPCETGVCCVFPLVQREHLRTTATRPTLNTAGSGSGRRSSTHKVWWTGSTGPADLTRTDDTELGHR